MIRQSALLALIALHTAACASQPTGPGTVGNDTAVALAGFRIQGDPESALGATWTYQATVDGIVYDLQGILRKPAGRGPFAAVILSHGNGGSANTYSRNVANVMVGWGLVAIATNYTHAGGVPIGAPGTENERGASVANVRRARKLVDLLRSLGYVDATRIAAHGHSMGAFVTTALTSSYPNDLRVASHTAGGVRPDILLSPAPSESQGRAIRVPYQIHHGEEDDVVPVAMDQRLAALLSSAGVVHELRVYPGAGHADVASNATVLERVRAWYAAHGLFQ
jgi:dienelactone hydrolase